MTITSWSTVAPLPTGPRRVRTPLGTEFGRQLASLVRKIPSGVAAVLSDDEGDAIDYVHDPAEVSEIDVQLIGAQLGQAILQIAARSVARGMHHAVVVLESEERTIVAASPAKGYVLALLLERRANVAAAMRAFADTCECIGRLL